MLKWLVNQGIEAGRRVRHRSIPTLASDVQNSPALSDRYILGEATEIIMGPLNCNWAPVKAPVNVFIQVVKEGVKIVDECAQITLNLHVVLV
jgi:hypothetical protein